MIRSFIYIYTKLKENRTRFLPVSHCFSHSHSHCQKKASNLKSVPRLGCNSRSYLNGEHLQCLAKYYFDARDWLVLYAWHFYIYYMYKKTRGVYIIQTHMHIVRSMRTRQKNACSIYITYIYSAKRTRAIMAAYRRGVQYRGVPRP